MSKELNAREWIETNEVANLDLPDSVHEMDIEGKVKELCIAFGESYATARLEAYKAELEEVIKTQSYQDLYREGSPTVIEVKHLKTVLE